MLNKIISFVVLFCSLTLPALSQRFNGDPFAHTYSIVARDSVTGEIGIAVQSHWFSVGKIVPWAEAGVGAVATQSLVNPSYGPEGLKLLREGKSPAEIINLLTEKDSGRAVRQLAVIDKFGETAAYTGSNCIQPAGHISGKDFSVQANLMKNGNVWPAMAAAFQNSKGPLAERMLASLEAGQQAGGDIRGMQSAYLLVVAAKPSGKIWEDRKIDLRVDDNADPVNELKRLLKVFRAYDHLNAGDAALEKNDMPLAEREYDMAEEMFPDNLEMKFWHAVTLINNNKTEKAFALLREVFSKDGNWRTLIPNVRKSGLLQCSDEIEKTILALK
jgi:uncharacterized Ntn-hydrolase superfamily protein